MKYQSINNEFPDWILERYLLEELPEDEMNRIQREAASNDSLKHRLDVLKNSNQDLLDRYPASSFVQMVRAKQNMQTSKKKKRFRVSYVPALSTAVIVLCLLLIPVLFNPGTDQVLIKDQQIRIKGFLPHLRVYRKTDTGSELLNNGAVAREHDLILIQYLSAGEFYGVIFSLDTRGELTWHLPPDGQGAAQLKKSGAISLDHAYELDDAPGWEKFYFITSDQPFEIDAVVKSARKAINSKITRDSDRLELPDIFEQFIFTLRKDEIDE